MAVSNAAPEVNVAPKSAYVSDPSLLPFIQPVFNPADYLNAALPSLSLTVGPAKAQRNSAGVSLAELSTQTQTLLSQLNAQTSRLSTILTQLTDDILRCGGRLAYEVEVLRGETIGLTEALSEGLQQDIARFVPQGITLGAAAAEEVQVGADGEDGNIETASIPEEAPVGLGLPPHLEQLRTLTRVRSRLESVIKVFGEAMSWTLPPSEVSLASSLISVSAPEPGSDSSSREEKAREFAETLRSEIAELVAGSEGDEEGYDAAIVRIQALRDLAEVWKGTAEEKARIKFVDNLARLAEEKQKARGNAGAKTQQRDPVTRSQRQLPNRPGALEKGRGFLENLQRMRDNIYLE